MTVLHFYSTPGMSSGYLSSKIKELQEVPLPIKLLDSELCYNVEVSRNLSDAELHKLIWLFSTPFGHNDVQQKPFFLASGNSLAIEIGPRLNFSTPFSSNAVSICHSMGLNCVLRLEKSIRYLVTYEGKIDSKDLTNKVLPHLHDLMTECHYIEPIKSFDHGIKPENWFTVDIISKGKSALREVNDKLGLAFDDWDIDYYYDLFVSKLKRNPTSVECFDLAQSNSEHSRHWFFKGNMVINNKQQDKSLLDMIIETQNTTNQNNVIKFSDNSSAIEGYEVKKIMPQLVDEPSSYLLCNSVSHLIFTAETHNFPTGVAPFSGATTGTGGRIRDVQAVGRGGHCIAGTAGYSVGNLLIPGYNQPWENKSYDYPDNLASPLKILIEASNGASDYGNKFGEPLICGFTRSFGLEDNYGERREWIKPIMFSGGVGSMESYMVNKLYPEQGMLLAKVGGPAYRIGVGGGAASSVQVHGDNATELDFGAVQRGDAEMGNKLNRIIRACIEDGQKNPICSIHDQGAGGNGNVLKEIVEPEGAIIYSKAFTLGDNSLSTMELWGAEYQESNAILVRPENENKLLKISHRERCSVDFVGVVTGDKKVVLSEEDNYNLSNYSRNSVSPELAPFNLELHNILGKMPKKTFILEDRPLKHVALQLPTKLTVNEALQRVLRLVTVGSKRFLTNKVDRSVTGLVAQQQCVGPLHTPISDYAITALSMFSKVGVATSIGEQPIKGLCSPEAGARMTVAEAITNLMFAGITCLKDVKCSGNWMWAAKLKYEGSSLYKTCSAMCKFMSELGIGIDGGKDSLSMAVRLNNETVKAPGTLVVSTYAPCPDVTVKVTPDMKSPAVGNVGSLLWISIGDKHRLGGSALAQCFSQLGSDVPDVDSPQSLISAFEITQQLIKEEKILAGHDISDGGLITCVLEMAFAGLSGLELSIDTLINGKPSPLEILFSEEIGFVIEVKPKDTSMIKSLYQKASLKCSHIGNAVNYGMGSKVIITDKQNKELLLGTVGSFFQWWEETSYQLECKQASKNYVTEEFQGLLKRKGPKYHITFNPDALNLQSQVLSRGPRVAVIREEGINGDREMAASLYMVGFETWDITMQDLLDGKITLDMFRGVIFPGGFSYADVLGSAKGWAASLLFNKEIRTQMELFRKRPDTFSLGVCNGCQLLSLLGWVGPKLDIENSDSEPENGVLLSHNKSERYECRFTTIKIMDSPSIMCKDMAGCILGVWIAHGEGQFIFRNEETLSALKNSKCISLQYVDDDNKPTECYPMNPNGSKDGIAGICSKDGRHLALMPHPERCTVMWQWPYVPDNMKTLKTSPWVKLFQNAYNWVNSS